MGLVALLIAVLPANVYMAMDRLQFTATPLPTLLLWARVPLQLVLIWWVLWCSKAEPKTVGPHDRRTVEITR